MGDLEPHLVRHSLALASPKLKLHLDWFSCFYSSPQSVPILYNRQLLPLSKLPLPMGDLDPRLIHGSLDQPESSAQTACRSVQPFLQGLLPWLTDQDWQTTLLGLTAGRICVRSTAMWPKGGSCNDNYRLEEPILWSPYGIGQTIIFSSCRLFFFLLFSWPNLSRRILAHMVWP